MNNIVQLQTPKAGDQTFMMCGCDPKEPRPFLPIVILQQSPVVVALRCLACERHLTVVNGIIQEPVPRQQCRCTSGELQPADSCPLHGPNG